MPIAIRKTDAVAEACCYVVAGLPSTDLQRLKPPQIRGLLDAAAERALNELARLAALCCEVPVALISLSDRVGRKDRPVGSIGITCRDHRLPLCTHVIGTPAEVMVTSDVRCDSRFAGNLPVIAQSGMAFIAAAPLVAPTGEIVGALCIADYAPARARRPAVPDAVRPGCTGDGTARTARPPDTARDEARLPVAPYAAAQERAAGAAEAECNGSAHGSWQSPLLS